MAYFEGEYERIFAAGEREHPKMPAQPGRRGRPKQSKATNLLSRLRDHQEAVWRFAREAPVPFTNNLSELQMRMPKVKLLGIQACQGLRQHADERPWRPAQYLASGRRDAQPQGASVGGCSFPWRSCPVRTGFSSASMTPLASPDFRAVCPPGQAVHPVRPARPRGVPRA
jgi:hypothetical protein